MGPMNFGLFVPAGQHCSLLTMRWMACTWFCWDLPEDSAKGLCGQQDIRRPRWDPLWAPWIHGASLTHPWSWSAEKTRPVWPYRGKKSWSPHYLRRSTARRQPLAVMCHLTSRHLLYHTSFCSNKLDWSALCFGVLWVSFSNQTLLPATVSRTS